jgi:hypothetical protein
MAWRGEAGLGPGLPRSRWSGPLRGRLSSASPVTHERPNRTTAVAPDCPHARTGPRSFVLRGLRGCGVILPRFGDLNERKGDPVRLVTSAFAITLLASIGAAMAQAQDGSVAAWGLNDYGCRFCISPPEGA